MAETDSHDGALQAPIGEETPQESPQVPNGEETPQEAPQAQESLHYQQQQQRQASDSEIKYSIDSFYAIVQPVFLCMLLTAIAVVAIRTEEYSEAAQESLNSYAVLRPTPEAATASKIGQNVVNALVIVGVICLLTFLIVILYKYRCMKCLIGYMILSCTLLLGYMAGSVFQVAIEKWSIPIDLFSFYFIMWNFAIVGVLSIVRPAGAVPKTFTQGYLIVTSSIVSWHFSNFETFLAWILLIFLALYDLFAVLTPCGPLKFLINLMQQDDAPDMPGLLYEASLSGATRSNNNRRPNTTTNNRPNRPSVTASSESSTQNNNASEPEGNGQDDRPVDAIPDLPPPVDTAEERINFASVNATRAISTGQLYNATTPEREGNDTLEETAGTAPLEREDEPTPEQVCTGRLPLAIAKLYKLRFLYDPQPHWIHADSDEPPPEYTVEQLRSEVEVVFPTRGGRILPTVTLDFPTVELYQTSQRTEATRYTVIDYRGEHRRILFVNREGRVFEDTRESEENKKDRSQIRLGLGDFIFYSLLCAKAALYSYTAFVVCSLAIITGLGLTLVMLAVYGKALPALPISILLGVVFFLFTRYIMEPFIHEMFILGVFPA